MASSKYGRKLNPLRRLREQVGIKGKRQSVVVTNNPSTIDQNQHLLVRFPNHDKQDVIVPGTTCLAFIISLDSTDANRTVVKNLGQAIVKKKLIRISGDEIMSIYDSDVIGCYTDLWKPARDRKSMVYQSIDTSEDANVLRLRVDSGNGDTDEAADKAIADAYKNRFCIPLDFELLESHMPFFQAGLSDRLEYELTFNDYKRVI